MALIEINLEKPAIIEERPGAGGSAGRARAASGRSGSGGKGKLVGLLVLVVGIGLLAAKLRGGGDTEMEMGADVGSMDETDEMDTTEGQSGGTGKFAGALGLVVAVATVALAVAKRRR